MSEPTRSAADTIPADLTERDQWVLWKYETRSGKPTKAPYQPDHHRASTTSKATWRSYTEICAAYNRNGRSFSGIGFVFTPDDPYLGIDLDNCLEGGTLKPWARPVIEAFHDTYAEISPSGNGVKIFAKGRLPGKGHRKDFGDHAVELYDNGRFFAITGKAFNAAPLQIEEHQTDIEKLYGLISRSPAATRPPANGSGKIPQGQRHNTLLSLAGSMRRRGMSPEAIEAALWTENTKRCEPPYDRAHIRKLAESTAEWQPEKTRNGNNLDDVKRPLVIAPEIETILNLGSSLNRAQSAVDLLGEVESLIRMFVVLPECAYLPISLWVAATYLSKEFDAFPYIALVSPVKRCGKTRLLEVLELLSALPWRGTTPTPAALYRMMAESPTLLLDEVEALMNKHASETQQTLLAILNAGHRQGATIPRCDGNKHELKHFPVYGPKAFAAIGRLPDSLMDRSIVITMQRRKPDQRVERFLHRRAKAQALPIAHNLVEFGDIHAEAVRSAYEHFVATDLNFLSDRDADLWIPLFALCSIAAPHRMPELQVAARELSGSKAADDQADSLPLKLLADMRDVWPEEDEHIETPVLIERLRKQPESPWGKPKQELSAHRLAKMLRPFGVRPIVYREGATGGIRGYLRTNLDSAIARYLTLSTATSATSLQGEEFL